MERRYCLLRLIKRTFIVPKFHIISHIFAAVGTKVRTADGVLKPRIQSV
jgi:hypothetical protein